MFDYTFVIFGVFIGRLIFLLEHKAGLVDRCKLRGRLVIGMYSDTRTTAHARTKDKNSKGRQLVELSQPTIAESSVMKMHTEASSMDRMLVMVIISCASTLAMKWHKRDL